MKYIKRMIEAKLIESSKTFKSVLVTGARQVGKSTVLKNVFPGYKYVSLDDPFLEEQAKSVPAKRRTKRRSAPVV